MALSSGYVPGLDGLRAISIGLVLAGHFFGLPGGAIGVDIFFVISGYLITTILLREVAKKGNFSLKSFYIRRVLRIFPAFAFMLLALLIVTPFFVHPERQPLQYLSLLYAAAYAMNWTRIFANRSQPRKP